MKNQRIIKKNHEFQNIISSKRSFVNSNFILYIGNQTKPKNLRYGISVGKKIGNAVTRNHIKREVRMIVNGLLDNFGSINKNVVIVARKRFVYRDFETNKKLLIELFKDLQKGESTPKK